MYKTLTMMKSILNGKEKEENEIELIKKYKQGLYPNILAYFYINNFGLISNISQLYPIINNEDKASFCLQELDNCLQNYDETKQIKFITYFYTCLKNRFLMETNQLLTYKRKALIDYELIDNLEIESEIDIDNIDYLLDNYNLSENEKKQCKYINAGYTLKEIANKLKLKPITIYIRQNKIKQKILKMNINFA